MTNPAVKKITRILIVVIGFLLVFASFARAFEQGSGSAKKRSSIAGKFQEQARDYCTEGLRLQQEGKTGEAMVLFQKAALIDPGSAEAHNHIGVIYEIKGQSGLAEEYYRKALQIDPDFLSVYSNLALLYEQRRNLATAAYYWKKRAALGLPNDPWTQKARERLNDILMVSGKSAGPDDLEVAQMLRQAEKAKSKKRPKESKRESKKDASEKRKRAREAKKAKQEKRRAAAAKAKKKIKKPVDYETQLVNLYLSKARQNYASGNYLAAFQDAINAWQIEPTNRKTQKFLDKVQTQMLSR
ncbi:tetratricopeptide repeat protein [Candidatus Omnitrophota bacterium]